MYYEPVINTMCDVIKSSFLHYSMQLIHNYLNTRDMLSKTLVLFNRNDL